MCSVARQQGPLLECFKIIESTSRISPIIGLYEGAQPDGNSNAARTEGAPIAILSKRTRTRNRNKINDPAAAVGTRKVRFGRTDPTRRGIEGDLVGQFLGNARQGATSGQAMIDLPVRPAEPGSGQASAVTPARQR